MRKTPSNAHPGYSKEEEEQEAMDQKKHLALGPNLEVLFRVEAVSGIASVSARRPVPLPGNLSQDSVERGVSVQDLGVVLSIPLPQAGHAPLLSLLQLRGRAPSRSSGLRVPETPLVISLLI